MNSKKIVYSALAFSLFCLAGCPLGIAVAQEIPNYGPADFKTLLTGIAKAVTGLVGGLGTIMIIVAGIMYLTSGGSQERMGAAKKTLFYAVVGLAIALCADAIINFITNLM